MRHRIFHAGALQLISQQLVQRLLRHEARASRGRADHQHELAARLQRAGRSRQFGNLRAPDLLVQFRHLAADRGIALAHDVGEIGERALHPAAGFEHDERRVDPRKLGQPRAARGLLRRQKSFEEKPVGGERRDRERRQHRGRARQRDHLMAGRADLAHQLETGIGDQGRAGIGDQRDGGALRQLFQDFRPRQCGVVFVIGF